MFKVNDRQITSVEPFEYLPVTEGEKYELCEALKMGETATKCGVAEKPTHICMGPSDGVVVPAMPVVDTTRFEAPYTAEPAIGAAVKIDATGLQVTAEAGGAFTVTHVNEEKKVAYGYFK